MSRIYDNWERLVGAVIKREQDREMALASPSSRSSFSSTESYLSSFASPNRHDEFCDGDRAIATPTVARMQKYIIEFDGRIQKNQARPPSVVAKLMGLDTQSDYLYDNNMGSSWSFQEGEVISVPKLISKRNTTNKLVESLSLSSNLRDWPSWISSASSKKVISRFPTEPVPWKQSEGTGWGVQNTAITSISAKAQNSVSSLYIEVEKRLKHLESIKCNSKDLRALNQILEALARKALLTEENRQCSKNKRNHFLKSA